jgi:DNA-binding transcriptional LysR family regulator
MDIRQIECLVTIVDTGGFGRAGSHLGISQPAVSLQIRRLEEALGGAVFARDGRAVRLTALGESILPHARETLRAIRGIHDTASQARGVIAGSVTVGAIPGWGIDVIPRLLARFREVHPLVAVRLVEALAGDLIQRVREGELDAAITGTAAPSTHGLPHAVLFQSAMVAVVYPSHPLAGRDAVPLADLLAHPVMCNPANSGIRATIDAARRQTGLPLVVQLESGNPRMLVNLAAHRLGIAIVPDDDDSLRQRRDVHVLAITDPPVIGNVELIWTTQSAINPAVREFLALAQE